MYGYALQHYGRDYVLRHVGVEPTGEAFNSIVLDEVANRPFNPMVNAGAIALAALMIEALDLYFRQCDLLDAEGAKSAVIEAQGTLFFGTTEQLLRRIAELSETARYIIVDFKRVHLADS